MRIRYLFFSEPPINDIPHKQFFLERMTEAEAHSAYDTDGDGVLIHTLLRTDIAFHRFCSFLLALMIVILILYRNRSKIKGDLKSLHRLIN